MTRLGFADFDYGLASRAYFSSSLPKQTTCSLNMTDFDTTLSPSPPLEFVTYVWAEPGASTKIEGFAHFEILTVALDGE